MPHPSAPNAYPSAVGFYPSAPDTVGAGGVSTIVLVDSQVTVSTSILGSATSNIVSAAFTPQPGELLEVDAGTWAGSCAIQAVAGGGLTWQQQSTVGPVSQQSPARLWTATVDPNASVDALTNMTITVTLANSYSGQAQASFVYKRWTGAAVGAVIAAGGITANPAATTIGSQTVGAVVSWSAFDYNGAVADTGPAYLSGATPTNTPTLGAGAYCAYYAQQTVTAAGTQTVGMSSPPGQNTSIVAVELVPTVLVSATSNPLAGLVDDFTSGGFDPARWLTTTP